LGDGIASEIARSDAQAADVGAFPWIEHGTGDHVVFAGEFDPNSAAGHHADRLMAGFLQLGINETQSFGPSEWPDTAALGTNPYSRWFEPRSIPYFELRDVEAGNVSLSADDQREMLYGFGNIVSGYRIQYLGEEPYQRPSELNKGVYQTLDTVKYLDANPEVRAALSAEYRFTLQSEVQIWTTLADLRSVDPIGDPGIALDFYERLGGLSESERMGLALRMRPGDIDQLGIVVDMRTGIRTSELTGRTVGEAFVGIVAANEGRPKGARGRSITDDLRIERDRRAPSDTNPVLQDGLGAHSRGQIDAALSARRDAYKAWKQNAGIEGAPTLAEFRRFMGAHRPNSRGETFYEANTSGFAAWSRRIDSDHGNTAGNQLAWLYRLESTDSGFLKWGISGDPFTRYTGPFMRDKIITPIQQAPRWEILRIERDLVETQPGPLNREPWRGARQP
jgi:hypothetical protein